MLVGVYRLAGRTGLVAAELTLIVLGNPWAAAASAPELLPQPWSTLGHRMPLGATVDLVRSISGFNGAGISGSVLTLSAWAALGPLMVGISNDMVRAPSAPEHAQATPPVPDPQPVRAARTMPERSALGPGSVRPENQRVPPRMKSLRESESGRAPISTDVARRDARRPTLGP